MPAKKHHDIRSVRDEADGLAEQDDQPGMKQSNATCDKA